ncbi:D-aspartate oxidase [Neonectria magnoliae]|uniref:D-aspartate oxidase n=1 Tax=Neonectria magnoliae TaxID=2732573 RepID=A0ABR1HF55_9HYPO
MAPDSIVIVGAGIIGLDVGLVLCDKGYGKYITVIAEHLPGDTSLTYTSRESQHRASVRSLVVLPKTLLVQGRYRNSPNIGRL